MTNRLLKILLLCFGHVITSHAQNYLFSIGPVYSPFAYQNYNSSDWDNRPDSYHSGNSQLNGSSMGVRIQVPISDKFIIEAGATYSNQRQEHTSYTISKPGSDSVEAEFIYNSRIETKFNMISVPLYFSFNQELGYKSNWFLHINAGPQVSFLTNYESTYTSYAFDFIQQRILYDSITNYIIRTPGKNYQKYLTGSPPAYEEHSNETPYLYSKILFGISGGIEIQKIFADNFLIGLGAFSDYDFTNSEDFPNGFWAYPYLAGSSDGDRAKSHNFRIGLTLTVQYVFY